MDDEDDDYVDCAGCKYYDIENGFCTAFECNGFDCPELPCEED